MEHNCSAQLKQVRAGDLQVENLSIIVKDLQDRKIMGWREVQVDFIRCLQIFLNLFPVAFWSSDRVHEVVKLPSHFADP